MPDFTSFCPKRNESWTKNTGKRPGKGLHDSTCWCVVSLLPTLHSVLEFLHIGLQDDSQMYGQWLALSKREEDRKIRRSLIDWAWFHCFMWFATSSSSRFISSFHGYSSLRRIPVVGGAPVQISCTSNVESRTVLMLFNTFFC